MPYPSHFVFLFFLKMNVVGNRNPRIRRVDYIPESVYVVSSSGVPITATIKKDIAETFAAMEQIGDVVRVPLYNHYEQDFKNPVVVHYSPKWEKVGPLWRNNWK